MVTCPNCGRETDGDYCQWCHYPILSRGLMRRQKAEKQAKKEAERLAKEQAKREAEEVRKAKEAEERARKEAVQDIGSEIYEGDVELVVPSPAGFKQVRQFKERLERVENLRVVWSGGSVDEGSVIGVSVQKPMTLIRILNEMPTLEKVDKKGERIVVMLKTPTVS